MASALFSTDATFADEIPAVTLDYSQAVTKVINQNIQEAMDFKPLSKYLQCWYMLNASMDTHRPGYVFDEKDTNRLINVLQEHQRQEENIAAGVTPTCKECGCALCPGTLSTETRVRSVTKKKRKRQPKRRKPKTQQQPDGLAEHPDLQVPGVEDAKNELVVTCTLCEAKCTIPGLERERNNTSTSPQVTAAPRGAPNRRQNTLSNEQESAEFIPLDDLPPPLEPVGTTAASDRRKKKKKKKKPSQLHDFLATLND